MKMLPIAFFMASMATPAELPKQSVAPTIAFFIPPAQDLNIKFHLLVLRGHALDLAMPKMATGTHMIVWVRFLSPTSEMKYEALIARVSRPAIPGTAVDMVDWEVVGPISSLDGAGPNAETIVKAIERLAGNKERLNLQPPPERFRYVPPATHPPSPSAAPPLKEASPPPDTHPQVAAHRNVRRLFFTQKQHDCMQ